LYMTGSTTKQTKPKKKRTITKVKKRTTTGRKSAGGNGAGIRNTLTVRLATAAPAIPGVGGGNSGGGGSSSSSAAGAPASTTILTGGVGSANAPTPRLQPPDDLRNDRIFELLTRIEGNSRGTSGFNTTNMRGQDQFIPVPGPRGEQGLPGKDSIIAGPQGLQGRDSTVAGPQGLPGRDSTVAGPQGLPGRDSTVAGPRGLRGAKGDKGDSYQNMQGPSSFVYEPNGQLVPAVPRNDLGRAANAVQAPADTSALAAGQGQALLAALERAADSTTARLQPSTQSAGQGQAQRAAIQALQDAPRGTAQKRPANLLADSIDTQAAAAAAAMDTGGLNEREQLDYQQRQRRDLMRLAADGQLAVPLAGIGLTPSTSGVLVRAGPLIEQLPDPENRLARVVADAPARVVMDDQLALRTGRALIPSTGIDGELTQRLALMRNPAPVPQVQGGQLVQRGARELAQFYPQTEDEFGTMDN
jgi:hypothetical protein